ncbi:amino acid permease [Alloacidobacterium dinghuense]|uniref:Amino acid permease n=1 Tax=Alloacidobacterium dinghuense TaxID=2763107 RepID=A0A7G8BP61_9BACT|nr:amino acid permease [Alloacidobacterium dinghuense]QNI34331.1 amino acid permease [Alloacidobacterium dinghuense]
MELPGQAKLGRQMGLASAVAVVTGESIALGIFLTPAAMAKSLGSPLLLAAVWCGMALVAISGALCYSELAVRFPQAGGEYVYLREGYGSRVAFLYGWMSAAVIDPGLAAALSVGAVPYVQSIVTVSPRTATLLPAAILISLGIINYVGTRLSSRVMATANLVKIAVLFALVAWAFVSGHASTANLLPLTTRRPGSEALFGAIAGATVNAFFSFGGWWEAGKLAGEVKNPKRTLPLAFVCGVLLVTAVYLLVSFAFLLVVPLERIVSNTAFVAQFGQALFGSAGGKVLSACVLLSVIGGLMALTMVVPRVYYAMARDGAFFSVFGRLHPRFGTPANAVLLQMGGALLVLCFGAFDRILAYIIFSAICFLSLSAASLFRLKEPVRRWWYPLAPIVFLVGSGIIALLILMHDPVPALIGVAVVLCGDLLRRWLISARPVTATEAAESSLL